LDSQGLDGGNQFVSFHKRLTEVRKHALKEIFVRDDHIKEVFPLQGNEAAYLRQGFTPLSGKPLYVCRGLRGSRTGFVSRKRCRTRLI
jgi:hypothetical protein